MIRTDFSRSMKRLESELITLGQLVEIAVDKSVQALKDRDLETSRAVIADGSEGVSQPPENPSTARQPPTAFRGLALTPRPLSPRERGERKAENARPDA